jgi:hypothetical protein
MTAWRGQSPPVFLVGSARSGTTLLHSMLHSHSELAIPPETHLVRRSLRRARRFVCGGRIVCWEAFVAVLRANPYLEPLLPYLPAGPLASVREVVEAMFVGFARSRGKRRWGEKTPHHLWYWRDLDRLFPESRFLVMVRDGRDVACSLSRMGWSSASPLVNAARWKAEWLLASRLLRTVGERALRVKYEDLVLDAELVLNRVCGFLGLRFEPAMVEGFSMNLDVIHDREWGWKAKNVGALSAGSIGRHRKDLSTAELRRVESLIRRELREAGPYDCDSRPLDAPAAFLVHLGSMVGFALELARRRLR